MVRCFLLIPGCAVLCAFSPPIGYGIIDSTPAITPYNGHVITVPFHFMPARCGIFEIRKNILARAKTVQGRMSDTFLPLPLFLPGKYFLHPANKLSFISSRQHFIQHNLPI
jgi:hypothetical protein